MEQLSIERINENAPYKVSMGETKISYCFTTCHGVDYSIDFVDDDLIESDASYQLIIANLNNKKSPRDYQVRDTIVAIIEEFFTVNAATILYICETGDNKQSMRNRLFEYWFSGYKYKYLYTLLSSAIQDEDGVMNYATLIVRNDNPRLVDVVSEFTNSVNILNQKP